MRIPTPSLLAALALALLAPPAGATQLTAGMFESVQAAVARAHAGDVVEVIGPHEEQITLPAGVTLRGKGAANLTWRSGPVLRVAKARDVVVEDLTIMAPNAPAAIELVDAGATVRRCTIYATGDGVAVQGASEVAIAQNQIHGEVGIHLGGHSKGTVSANVLQGCNLHGIAVFEDALPLIAHNTLTGSHHAGLAYFGHAGGVAEDNLCRANGEFGILLAHEAGPTLRHNTLLDNGHAGIMSTSTGPASALANLIAHNGMQFSDGAGVSATPPLKGLEEGSTANLVLGNRYQGDAQPSFVAGANAFVLARADGTMDDRYGWSGPPASANLGERPKDPPVLRATASFKDASGNGVLEAEEAASIELRIENAGKGKATLVRALCESQGGLQGLTVPASLMVGDLAPGEVRKALVPLSGRTDLQAGKATVQVALEDAFGFDAPIMKTTFETHPYAKPALALRGLAVEDANGNGVLERGEQLDLRVQVANPGGGLARKVVAKLQLDDPRIKATGDEAVELGDLSPGAVKEARFSILVLNRYDGPQALPVSVVLSEAHAQFGATAPLQLALDRAAPATIEQVVAAVAPASPAVPEEDDLAVPAKAAPPNPNAFALVIGIERYNGQLPAATYARRDAEAFRRFCERALGVPRENAIVLTDDQATGGNIRTALEGQLARWVEKGKSDLYVYFAGHGAPDAATHSAFLVPYDGNPSYPGTSCYPLGTAYDALARLGARSVTVVLDSCFSGQSNRADQARPLVANLRPLFIEATAQAVPAGLTVFAAASGSQTSTGFGAKKHGLFTYFMLKGLQGEADANHDHQVTVGELRAYLGTQVPREARRLNQEQVPSVSGDDGRVLVVLP